jgi:hypothetical protein
MWVLVFVLLHPVFGQAEATVLAQFPTHRACQRERDRIGYEMAASYPYERDFVLECRVRGPQWRA